jgi:sugar lactone lactonase YvrE
MYMEVFDSAGFYSYNNWVPAYAFYDASHLDYYGAYTSFNGGFWYNNSSPTVSSIPNMNVVLGTGYTAPTYYTINDIETPVGSLAVVATSDNQTVLPDSRIYYPYTGTGSRYLEVYPAAAGVAHVTVKVTDSDGASSQTTFTVTADSAPTITVISNQLVQMNSNTPAIPFTVGDAYYPPSALILTPISGNTTLVPLANVVIGGSSSSSNRTVTVTPAPNQYGVTTVGVRVSNGVATNASTFTLTVNSPPSLAANNGLTVSQGGTATITSSLLQATDPDNTPAQVKFTVNPDGSGGPPHNGTLLKSGIPLTTGGTFTMADVTNNLVSYHNGGSCETNDDFQFGLTDTSGGVLVSAGHTVFSFKIAITPLIIPPVAVSVSNTVPLGGTVSGTLTAVNTDCRNTNLTFSLGGLPAKGILAAFNPATGQYTYQANSGQSGADSFDFLVSNGGAISTTPGTVYLNIQNAPPVALGTNFMTAQGTSLTNKLSVTDPDQPPQPLTFSILSNGTKGTATLLNPATGAFVYTPQPSRFGQDSFTFKVNDGLTDSLPATVAISIRPTAASFGDLVISEDSLPAIVLLNVANGDVGILSSGGLLGQPAFLTTEPGGTILVADQSQGVLRIDPATGAQSIVVSNSLVPGAVGVAREADGHIIVSALGTGLVSRFTSGGVFVTNFPAGMLAFPAGVAIAPDGQIFVTDPGAAFGSPPNAIMQLDPVTLGQTVLATNGLLTSPVGIAWEPSGSLIVAEAFYNTLTRVTVPGGAQTLLTGETNLNHPFGVAVDVSGNIYVANGDGSVTQVNPVTGAQMVVVPPGSIGSPFGIAVAGQPVAPPILTGVQFTSAGQAQISLTGYPGATYSVLRSADLTLPVGGWTLVGTTTETTPGNFSVTDSGATNAPVRFYRASYP